MTSHSDRRSDSQIRHYERAESVVFLKTKETFGGLSNMASGFPLRVNGIRILTSEALYQACRFPHLPDVQQLIIEQTSPMTAKMKSKPFRDQSRSDWNHVRVSIMRWCLRVKLAQNWVNFSDLLLKTGDRPIVEQSQRDDFWGAKESETGDLIGRNVLGRLLMELREVIKGSGRDALLCVEPPAIRDFLLDGTPIETIVGDAAESRTTSLRALEGTGQSATAETQTVQAPLFDDCAIRNTTVPTITANERWGSRIADLTPYPEYKESNSAWLGPVPKHWPVLPNRALFFEVKDRNHPDEEMLSVTIARGIIRQKVLIDGSSKKDSSRQDKSAYKLVLPRDIAYNKMRAWQGAIGASTLRGIISPAYVVMRLRHSESLSSYFHHLFRTPHFAKEAERWSYGITSDMWSLRPEHFKMIYAPKPPVAEQEAIVRFLDWANGRLERAIRAKRKVIALLKEQEQAIIYRSVTRGLDHSVRFKPSGISWFGEIPEHWEVRQLRHMGRLHKGVGGSKEDATPHGVPCIRYGELYFHYRHSIRQPQGFVSSDRTAAYTPIRFGDVLFAASGETIEEIGKSAVNLYDGHAVCGGDVVIFRPTVPVNAEFFGYALDNYATAYQKATMCRGTTIKHIYPDELRGLWICVPPLAEQREIVNALSDELRGCNTAISRLQLEIDFLREYRTRLVADVVTGKLDVREAAERLRNEGPHDSVENDDDPSLDPEVANEGVGV